MVERSEQDTTGKRRQRDARAVRLFLVFLGFVLVVDLVGAVLIPEIRLVFLDWIALFSIWIGVYFPVVALHEAGHLLGGWLVGFQFRFVMLGHLKIARAGERIRISWAKGRRIPTGLAAAVPADDHDLRRRTAVFIACGPIASLLVMLLSLAAYFALGQHRGAGVASGHDHSVLSLTLLSSAGMSFLLFLLSTVPSHVGGWGSDGAKLLVLLRGGPAADRYTAILALVGMELTGRRAREWPASLVAMATEVNDGSAFDTAGAMLAYQWSLDRNNVAEAESYLKRGLAALEKYPAASRPAISLEAAYFTARHGSDPLAARGFLKQSKGGFLVKPYSELRAEAAVLLAEGDAEAAQRRAQDGLAAIRRLGDMDTAQQEADGLQELVDLSAARLGRTGAAAEDDRLVR